MMPATLALIRVTFDDERERNLAIAVWGSLSVVGAALGPIVGGLLLSHFWWGSVFHQCASGRPGLYWHVGLRAKGAVEQGKPWDLLSSVLALVTLSGLIVAIKEVAHAAPSWPLTFAALAVAVVGGWLFARRQARLPHPLQILRSSATQPLRLVLAAFAMLPSAACNWSQPSTSNLCRFHPAAGGSLVSAVALGSLPTALLGAFLHRLGLRVLIAGGLAAGATGALATTAGLHLGLGWLLAGMVLNGAGWEP